MAFKFSLTLNGTESVSLEGSDDFFRIFRCACVAGQTNVGNVDILIGGAVALRIPAGVGQSETTILSVSDEYHLRIYSLYASMLQGSGTTPRARVKAYTRTFEGPWHAFLPAGSVTPDGGQFYIPLGLASRGDESGILVEPGSDIKIMVDSFSGTSADIQGGYEYHSFRNIPGFVPV